MHILLAYGGWCLETESTFTMQAVEKVKEQRGSNQQLIWWCGRHHRAQAASGACPDREVGACQPLKTPFPHPFSPSRCYPRQPSCARHYHPPLPLACHRPLSHQPALPGPDLRPPALFHRHVVFPGFQLATRLQDCPSRAIVFKRFLIPKGSKSTEIVLDQALQKVDVCCSLQSPAPESSVRIQTDYYCSPSLVCPGWSKLVVCVTWPSGIHSSCPIVEIVTVRIGKTDETVIEEIADEMTVNQGESQPGKGSKQDLIVAEAMASTNSSSMAKASIARSCKGKYANT